MERKHEGYIARVCPPVVVLVSKQENLVAVVASEKSTPSIEIACHSFAPRHHSSRVG